MKIDHINLVVADLERSATFYERVFGFKRGFTAFLEGEWFEAVTQIAQARAECLFLEIEGGGTRIELIRYDSPLQKITAPGEMSPAALGLRHFALEVEDLGATLQKMQKAGGEPLAPPIEVPFRVGNLGRKWLCYTRDPDGVLVELAAYQG